MKCMCLPSAILVVINERQRSSAHWQWRASNRHWSVKGADNLWCYYTGHKGALVPRRLFILVLISASTGQPGLWLSWERWKITAIAPPHPQPVGSHRHTHTHKHTQGCVLLPFRVNVHWFWKRRTGKLAVRRENKKVVNDCMCSPEQ